MMLQEAHSKCGIVWIHSYYIDENNDSLKENNFGLHRIPQAHAPHSLIYQSFHEPKYNETTIYEINVPYVIFLTNIL